MRFMSRTKGVWSDGFPAWRRVRRGVVTWCRPRPTADRRPMVVRNAPGKRTAALGEKRRLLFCVLRPERRIYLNTSHVDSESHRTSPSSGKGLQEGRRSARAAFGGPRQGPRGGPWPYLRGRPTRRKDMARSRAKGRSWIFVCVHVNPHRGENQNRRRGCHTPRRGQEEREFPCRVPVPPFSRTRKARCSPL